MAVAYVVHIVEHSLHPVVVAVDDVDNASVAHHSQVVVAVVDIHLVVVAYVVALVVDAHVLHVMEVALVVVAVVVVVALVH